MERKRDDVIKKYINRFKNITKKDKKTIQDSSVNFATSRDGVYNFRVFCDKEDSVDLKDGYFRLKTKKSDASFSIEYDKSFHLKDIVSNKNILIDSEKIKENRIKFSFKLDNPLVLIRVKFITVGRFLYKNKEISVNLKIFNDEL